MTISIVATNESLTRTVGDGDRLFVLSTGSVSVSGPAGIAIDATGPDSAVTIAGSVYGEIAGMSLTQSQSRPDGVMVSAVITSTGNILGENAGIRTGGPDIQIHNFGTVAAFYGVQEVGGDGPCLTTMLNAGVVDAEYGIVVLDNGVSYSDFVLVNDGTVYGRSYAYLSEDDLGLDTMVNRGLIQGLVDTGGFDDYITNRGSMVGSIAMGAGGDTFDNSHGKDDSNVVDMGADNDTVMCGSSAEVVNGGDGFDTVSFLNSAGVTLDLQDGSLNTGWAANDTYIDVEAFIGASHGDDILRGGGGDESLSGAGGADLLDGRDGSDNLDGGAGADVLIGGVGTDSVTGGAGDDSFVFVSVAEGGDRIVDFTTARGNHDLLMVSVNFASGLNGAAIAANQFIIRNDHAAQDADDRFIFDKQHHSLWYDNDGNGAGAAVLMADFAKSAKLTFADLHFTDLFG